MDEDMANHRTARRNVYDQILKGFIVVVLSTLLTTKSLCAQQEMPQRGSAPSAQSLVSIACLKDNTIVLTRTYELGVFSSAIGNNDNISDTYRIFPFHLAHPAAVQVDLYDTAGGLQAPLIPPEQLQAGDYYFVLSYQDVRGNLSNGKQFSLHFQATPQKVQAPELREQVIECPGILMENYSGDVLGRISVHDVLIHRGRLSLSRDDFELIGREPTLNFSRTYSNQPFDRSLYSSLGQGWHHNHERFLHVIARGDHVTPYNVPQWVLAAKAKFLPLTSLPQKNDRPRYVVVNFTHFKRIKNQWVANCTRHGTLEERDDGFFYVAKDGTRYFYTTPPTADIGTMLQIDAKRLANLRYTLTSAWPLGYIEDRNGNRQTPEYVQTCIGPMVTAVTDAVGRRITFAYDPPVDQPYAGESAYLQNPRRLKKIRGPGGIEMAFEYFPDTGLLKTVQRDVRSESYTYSPSQQTTDSALPALYRHHNLIGVKDANGHTTQYQYCRPEDIPLSVHQHVTALDPTQAVKAVVYPDLAKAIFNYDDTGQNQRTVVDLRGNPTTYVLNRFGNAVKEIEPLGRITEWTWQLDEDRNDILMTSQTDALGQTIHFEYDVKGNITRKKWNDGDTEASKWLPQYSGLLTLYADDRLMEKHIYDDKGNCVETTNENGEKTSFEYNRYGELIRKQESNGRITQFIYDPLGNLKERFENHGDKVIYTRDMRGRLLSTLASDGRQWTYAYDALDRMTYKSEPGEPELHIAYDAKGNTIRESYANEPPIRYAYDSRDRNIKIQVGSKTRMFTYDANTNLIRFKDFDGQVLTYRHNALNEEITAKAAAKEMQLQYQHIYKRLTAGISIPAEMASADWDQRQKVMKAQFLNRKGIFFYDRENFDVALKYFCQAVQMSNQSASHLRNAMSTFNQLENYRDGLDFIEKHIDAHQTDISLLSWHAWFLHHADQPQKAIDIYAALFGHGYRNEEDFQAYTDLLLEHKRYTALDKAFEDYIAGGRSEIVLLSQSKSLYKRKKYQAALKILEDLQKSKAFDPDIALARIRNYRKLAQYDNVRRICLQLLDGGFKSADAYYYKGDAEYMMEWLPEAKRSLEQALALSPKDKDIKSFIDHIAGRLGQGDNATIKEPIAAVPMPAQFANRLKTMTSKQPGDDVDAVFRYRLKCYRFSPEKHLTQTFYREVKILNAAGVSKFSTLKYDFNPLHDKIHVNKLVVKDQSGKPIATGNPDAYYVMDAHPDDMATYDKTLYLPVPNLAPGTCIEIVVTMQTKAAYDDFPFKREVLASSYPVQLAGLFVESQADSIVQETTNTTPPEQTGKGQLWLIENHAPYQWEPEQVDYERFLPVVYLGAVGQKWSNVGQAYWQSLKPKLQMDDKIRELALSLTKDKANPAAKMDAITQYVQKTITYKPLEFGTRGIIPNSAAETLANKYGDCKDHAVLLQQLLTAIDIPAHLVLVDTQWAIRPNLASTDQFNHMIVYAGSGDQLRYIDGTDKGLRPGHYVPPGLAGRRVLVLDPKHIRLETMPMYAAENCRVVSERQISIQETHDMQVVESVRFNGYPAAHLRSVLKSMDAADQKEWVKKIITRHHPDTTLSSVSISHLFETGDELTLQMTYTLKEACEQLNRQIRTKIPSAWEDYYLKVQPVEHRTSDFEIPYPLVFESRIKFEAPSHIRITDVAPPSKSGNTSYCSWQSRSHLEKQTLDMQFTIHMSDGIYSAAGYKRYRQTMNSAIKTVNRKITLIYDQEMAEMQ